MILTRVTDSIQINAVSQLAQQIWQEYYPAIIGQSQVEYMLATFQSGSAITQQIQQQQLHYYLIEVADRTVGYLAIQPRDDHSLFLSKLYVRADMRGQGYARAAVEYASALARELGLVKLSLTVNRHNQLALAVYTRLGFVTVGSIVTDIGGGFVMDDYQLEKPLT